MRPCRIKKPIPFAYDRLLGLVKCYGAWLNVEQPISTPESHPVFVQHECLEVEQLVKAFSRYQTTCLPAYPIASNPTPQVQPAQALPTQTIAPVQQPEAQGRQTDQNDDMSDQFNSGFSNNNENARNAFLNNWRF
jgi:hypothetical protein